MASATVDPESNESDSLNPEDNGMRQPKPSKSDESALRPPSKVHHVTVCMVPPPEEEYVWRTVSKMRRELKDPGFYRWPPHANLLYPFLEVPQKDPNNVKKQHGDASDENALEDILHKLHSATRQVPPFQITLSNLGTFGGMKRGVLWLSPESIGSDSEIPPLQELHQHLEEAFPMCKDQTKGGNFTPHMTLSHFVDLEAALTAKGTIEGNFATALPQLQFRLDKIYLLKRQGDGGQFLRVAEVGLGPNSFVQRLETPKPFPGMPIEEAGWVYDERMKLKARRNHSSGRRGGKRSRRGGRKNRRVPRIPDSPEVIAAKRAERKAKRERLAQEQAQQEIKSQKGESLE